MKSVKLSFLLVSLFSVANADEQTLKQVSVESSIIDEVSEKSKNSVDLGKALSDNVPSVDISRRSGVANDIYIRGQKRDNISVDMDGTKVCGACVNRMDPPISHIITSQIKEVEVVEGPFDVENFGTLSGGVKIKTKKPSEQLSGEADFGIGSWGYKKAGVGFSGGYDRIKALVSYTYEQSDQYRDGNGDDMAKQIDKAIKAGKAPAMTAFSDKYRDSKAYQKQSVMGKVFVKTLENQELRLSYTHNRSDDVLYPNSQMDARYDESNIYSIEYNIDDITSYYKNLNLQYYYSDVDHPMDTKYRKSGSTAYTTNHLKTSMQGAKLKNSFSLDGYNLLVGLDGSKRTWEGEKYSTNVATKDNYGYSVSLSKTTTNNSAIFTKLDKSFGGLKLELGARGDITHIRVDDNSKRSRDFNSLGANLLATYAFDAKNSLFFGFGTASRVPDARELYPVINYITGNENLKQTKNRELDLGYEFSGESLMFKAKTFYSMLKDYIYLDEYMANKYTFKNIDAKVYGLELSSTYYLSNALFLDAMASYKRGVKDHPKAGEDKYLADMAPLRGKMAFNYEYLANSLATLEVEGSDRWKNIDSSNGEQELSGWCIYNAKIKHAINKNIDLTLGVNNITNKVYTRSNSYVDIILLSSGGATMLLNEPGRYFYTNLSFKF